MRRTLLLASAIALVSTSPAFAQDKAGTRENQQNATARQDSAGADNRQMAQACLDRLDQFAGEMEDQGYWLTGWRGGWAGYGVRPMAPAMTPVTGGGTADVQPGAAVQPQVERDAHPRQGTYAQGGDVKGADVKGAGMKTGDAQARDADP